MRDILGWLGGLLLAVLSVPAFGAGGVITASYDAVNDFSSSINTASSTWSYRASTVHGGTYTLMNLNSNAPGPWSPGGPQPTAWSLTTSGGALGASYPIIGKNTTGTTQTFTPAPALIWPNNTILVHPDGGPNEYAILSWLAPASGTIDIRASFADAHPVGAANTGISYFIDRNAGVGGDSLLSGFVNDSSSSGLLSISNIGVTAGDRINFLIGLQSALNSNSTLVTAQIDFYAPLAPEPGSIVLAAAAGIGMAAFYGLRRRARSISS